MKGERFCRMPLWHHPCMDIIVWNKGCSGESTGFHWQSGNRDMTMGKTGIVAGVVLALAAALFVIRRRLDRARLETSTEILWE